MSFNRRSSSRSPSFQAQVLLDLAIPQASLPDGQGEISWVSS